MAVPNLELADEIEDFKLRYPIDEAAYNYIVKSTLDVQRDVLRDFKPKQEGEADYSPLIISFCKKRRQARQHEHFAPAPPRYAEVPPRPEDREELEELILALRERYPFDDAAFNYIMKSAPKVQREILTSFKPPNEGEDDYSALIISFAKKCRSDAVQFGDREEYEVFRQRYPFDEDTHAYLSSTPSDVRKYVMNNFKPPREGEADYSALLITYCKRCRLTAQDSRMILGGLKGFGKSSAAFAPPPARAYPPPPVRGQVGGKGSDRGASWGHEKGRGWGAGHEKGSGGKSWNGGGARRDAHRPYGGEGALWGFRDRYPMDDRAFAFLQGCSAEVQREVLDTFSPPRPDSDYSALIIGYAKRCQSRVQHGGGDAKRQRVY